MSASPLQVGLEAFVSPARVLQPERPTTKREILCSLIELTASHPAVTDKRQFAQAIFDREDVTSTGIGGGIAIPHARLATIDSYVISLAIARAGIDFLAQDGRPVQVVAMIAATDQDRKTYLRVLASVAARLKSAAVFRALIEARRPEDVVAVFSAAG